MRQVELILPYFFPEATSDEVKFYTADSILGYIYNGIDNYYYSTCDFATTVDEDIPSFIHIFPIPTLSEFSISNKQNTGAEFIIYNSTGLEVLRGSASQGITIVQTSSWTAGMYFVTVKLKNGNIETYKQVVF